MDLRRLGATVVLLVAAVVFLALYANTQSRQRQAAQATSNPAATPSSASAPAVAPATAPASGPALAPAATPAAPKPARATAKPATPAAPSSRATPGEKWFGTRAEPQTVTIGSADDPNGYQLQVQLSAAGAGISTAKLTNYFVTVQDKRLFDKDPRAYKAALATNPQEYQGHYSVLNPYGPEGSQVLSLATRGLTVRLQDDPSNELVLTDLDRKPWQLDKDRLTEDTAEYSYTVYRGPNWDAAQGHPVLRLVKTYSVRKGDYTVYVSLRMENLCGRDLRVSLDQLGPTGLPEETSLRGGRPQGISGQLPGEDRKVKVLLRPLEKNKEGAGQSWWARTIRGIGRIFGLGKEEPKPTPLETVGASDLTPSTLWIGTVNKYFGSMMYLVPTKEGKLAAPEWRARFQMEAIGEIGNMLIYAPDVSLPEILLPPQEPTKEVHLEVFVGPKKRDLFSDDRAQVTARSTTD